MCMCAVSGCTHVVYTCIYVIFLLYYDDDDDNDDNVADGDDDDDDDDDNVADGDGGDDDYDDDGDDNEWLGMICVHMHESSLYVYA